MGLGGTSSAAMNELATALHRSQVEAATKTRPRAFRRVLQTIHLWVGLILAIPIILIGLSGSALLLQREILRWSIPTVSSVGESQSIARMVAAAQASVDPTLRANSVELPSSRGRPALVQFQFANRPPRNMEVYVDPVSLKVLGSSEIIRRGPIRDVLVTMHEYLMLPGHIGLPLVGYIAVAMSFMGLRTGVAFAVIATFMCSLFVNAGNGAVYAMLPMIKRRLTGQIAGMVGAFGNVGGVLFLTIYSAVDVGTFFMVASCAALLALGLTAMFIDEPRGQMAEEMPDGSIAMIDVR